MSIPMLYQSVRAECGLACVAMIASTHGHLIDIQTLANRTQSAVLGLTLKQLRSIAEKTGLETRVVQVTPELLPRLRVPSILHWDGSHYVVLKKVQKNSAIIHDPNRGVRRVSCEELAGSLTGIALECFPSASFKLGDFRRKAKIFSLLSGIEIPIAPAFTIILLLAASQVAAITVPYFFQIAFDNVLDSADVGLLKLILGFFIAIVLADFLLKLTREEVTGRLGSLINVYLATAYLKKNLSLPLSFFDGRSFSDIASKYESLADIQRAFTWDLPRLAMDLLLTIVVFFALFQYNTQLVMLATGCILIYGSLWFFSRKSLNDSWESSYFKENINRGHLLETLQSIQTIKSFNLEEVRKSNWSSSLTDYLKAALAVNRSKALYSHTREGLLSLENLCSGFFLSLLLLREDLTMGAAVAFLTYKRLFLASGFSVIDSLPRIYVIRAQINRIGDIIVAEDDQLNNGADTFDKFSKISIESISHIYPGNESHSFFDISAEISAGDRVVLTGKSGAGKSTFLKVILKLLPSSSGEIRVGGTSLSEISARSWRMNIGTVFQHDRLLAGTIASNISLSQNADKEKLIKAATLACISEEIERLPMKFDTLVQDDFPLVSAGQKQRILIARALYRQPSLLFLDEGTASLDEASEARILANIGNMGVTVIHAAHRKQVIADATHIIEF